MNAIRGALGFTGSYRGMPVSVQTTGMGRPSLSIYVHELLTVYGVRTIVRIGSCGALDESVGIRSLVIASAAAMDFEVDSIDAWRRPDDGALRDCAVARGKADGHVHHVCPMVSSDVFYHPEPLGRFAKARARGVLACDMETSRALRPGRAVRGEGAVDLHGRRQPRHRRGDRQVGAPGASTGRWRSWRSTRWPTTGTPHRAINTILDNRDILQADF